MLVPAQTGMVWEDVSSDIDTTSSDGMYTVRYAKRCGNLIVFSVVTKGFSVSASDAINIKCFKTIRPLANTSLATFQTAGANPLITATISATNGSIGIRTTVSITNKDYQISGCFLCA